MEMRSPIILCKTCSVLFCVLEQSRVDNFSSGSNWPKTGITLQKTEIIVSTFSSYKSKCHRNTIQMLKFTLSRLANKYRGVFEPSLCGHRPISFHFFHQKQLSHLNDIFTGIRN